MLVLTRERVVLVLVRMVSRDIGLLTLGKGRQGHLAVHGQ
jgi:hypothetical protein